MVFPIHPLTTYNTPVPRVLTALLIFLLTSCGGTAPTVSVEYAVQGLYAAELSPGAQMGIIGSINHGGSLWQVINNERLFNWNHKKGEFSHIIAADFSVELDYAITASPQTMVLWNAKTGEGLSYWTAPSEILDISLLPQGNLALLGLSDHSAALFDVRNGGVKQVFYHNGRVTSVDIHSEKGIVLTGSEDYSAILWDLQNATPLQKWEHNDEVQLVKLSPDGTLAFTMAKYDKAAIWDTATGQSKGTIPLTATAARRGLVFTAAVFSADSRYLLTGTSSRIVQLWQLDTLTEIKKWKMPKRNPVAPTSAAVLALAFGNNGKYYAITSDGFSHTLE